MRCFLAALALAVLIAVALPAPAEESRLSADEIERVLAGNSVEGAWMGKPYRQYFDRSGLTVYQQKGAPTEKGKWRTQDSTDQYCSQWGPGGWACYDLLSDGAGGIIWRVPSDGYKSPARVVKGRKLY